MGRSANARLPSKAAEFLRAVPQFPRKSRGRGAPRVSPEAPSNVADRRAVEESSQVHGFFYNDSNQLRDGAVLFVALTIANITNFVFHAAMSRLLGPSAYGALGGLLSAFVWISVCAVAIQLVVARHMAALRHEDNDAEARAVFRLVLRMGASGGGVLGVSLAIASGWVAQFLRLGSVFPAILLAIYVVPVLLGAIARGALQGRLLFLPLAGVTAGTTVLRLVVAVALVHMGLGVSAAVGATVIAEVIGLAVALLPLRSLLEGPSTVNVASRSVAREAVVAVLAMGGFWAIVNLDTLLVRHYFPGSSSGFYTAAAVAARSVLFFPAAIVMAAFPHFAEKNGQARRVLVRTLGLVFVLGSGAAIFLTAFRTTVVGILFGDQYLPGAELLVTLAAAMAMLGLVNVFMYFFLASGSGAVWGFLPAIALQAASIVAFHGSVLQVAAVMAGVSLALLVFSVVAVALPRRQPLQQLVRLRSEPP